MFRIRMHGRGGQGIKTASQILGSAFFRAGFEVQDAPRYGAERRGAPIFAYVRADRRPVTERGVIARADLVMVADESLLTLPAAGVLQGLESRALLVLNSAESPGRWRDRLKYPGGILCLPRVAGAEPEAMQVGVICAGVAARLVGVIPRQAVELAVADELSRLPPAECAASRELALHAFDAMAPQAGLVQEGGQLPLVEADAPDWIQLGLDDAVLAAPDIEGALTSEQVNTGSWRTLKPVIDQARCRRCSWVCSTLCPDGAIRVDAEHRPTVDYDHCKGCLVCVAVCPPHAIAAVPEHAREASP